MPTLQRRKRDPSGAQSAIAVACWCLLAVAFSGLIAWRMGSKAGLQFATGYLLEWSLSVDNVFVFALIFRYFQVPRVHQYRILYWGIAGAVVSRLAFILAGAAVITRFRFVLPLLGLFLVYAAYRLARHSSQHFDPQRNLVYRLARRWLPMSEDANRAVSVGSQINETRQAVLLDGEAGDDAAADSGTDMLYGERFLVRQAGRWRITPPLLVLLVIEGTDLVFALDSIPAIFGITRDPLIVFTSNIFAILGLLSLYFLLAGVMDRFRYLHYGLAAVLAFVGLKMVGEGWLPHEGAEIMPIGLSLAVIAGLLALSIAASVLAGKREIRDKM